MLVSFHGRSSPEMSQLQSGWMAAEFYRMLPEKPAHLSTRTFPPADSCVVYRCNA
jgi:hypothetical protein